MITPESLLEVSDTEHSHQTALFLWAHQNIPIHPALRYMFAIPNGGQRTKVTASRLKCEGVKAGVPDIFLPYPTRMYHGLFIEMKRPSKTAKISPEQIDYIKYLDTVGYKVVVAYGYKQATHYILEYLTNPHF